MRVRERSACPECGAAVCGDAAACGLCGRATRGRAERPATTARATADGDVLPRGDGAEPRLLGVPRGLAVWTLGAALAPVLAATPPLRYVGWFLSSLVHEMGHTAAAWLTGCSALPAIRLDGHAMTPTFEPSKPAAFGVWAIAAAAAIWAWRDGRRRAAIAAGAFVVAFPVLAFTGARELLHLVGGHLGELAFATLALWRARTGRETAHLAERIAYAMLGWYLWGANLRLTHGLWTDAAARAAYAENGSFGLMNDYLRIAEDVLGAPLPAVAAAATLAALAVPVVAWRLPRRTE